MIDGSIINNTRDTKLCAKIYTGSNTSDDKSWRSQIKLNNIDLTCQLSHKI